MALSDLITVACFKDKNELKKEKKKEKKKRKKRKKKKIVYHTQNSELDLPLGSQPEVTKYTIIPHMVLQVI